MREISTKDLRDELELRGYYTRSLYHIDYVMEEYGLNPDEAMNILESALENDWLIECIYQLIDEKSKERCK